MADERPGSRHPASLPFADLRAEVETSTYLPEFRQVESRARKVRRRLRLRAAAVALAVAVPAIGAVALMYRQPTGTTLGITGGEDVVHVALPSGNHQPDTYQLVAADGVDINHLYGLVDVCSGNSCTLDLSSIDPNSVTGSVQRLGLFRTNPTDTLSNARLIAIGTGTVVVSARVNSGALRRDTLGVSPALVTQSPAPAGLATQRVVQPVPAGPIEIATAAGTVTAAASQPKLDSPALVCDRSGWWVTGTDPLTGALNLAVSDDSGRSWTSHSVGVDKVQATPAVAVSGNTIYLLVAADGQLLLRKSSDRGLTWSTLTAPDNWPASSHYGIIVRPDHSVLVWLDRNGHTTLMHSRDGGLSFAKDRGNGAANAPIVTVSDGYIMLGAKPALSRDAVTWTSLQVPWLPQH